MRLDRKRRELLKLLDAPRTMHELIMHFYPEVTPERYKCRHQSTLKLICDTRKTHNKIITYDKANKVYVKGVMAPTDTVSITLAELNNRDCTAAEIAETTGIAEHKVKRAIYWLVQTKRAVRNGKVYSAIK